VKIEGLWRGLKKGEKKKTRAEKNSGFKVTADGAI